MPVSRSLSSPLAPPREELLLWYKQMVALFDAGDARGLANRELAAELNAAGIPTRTGRPWTLNAIAVVRHRYAALLRLGKAGRYYKVRRPRRRVVPPRPVGDFFPSHFIRIQRADQWALAMSDVFDVMRREGAVTYRDVATMLNARGIPTRTGRPWTLQTVYLATTRARRLKLR